jgi:hypothetical protein
MAIFNTGNGGSALQYTVKVQKDRPTITGSKKVIWIKDDLTFLNPYDNEKNEKLDIMTTLRAYKNAADEKSKNECNATFVHTAEKNSAFIHLDKSLYVSNTILGCTLSTTNKYLKVTIPAKAGTPETGVKLKIGFSD